MMLNREDLNITTTETKLLYAILCTQNEILEELKKGKKTVSKVPKNIVKEGE